MLRKILTKSAIPLLSRAAGGLSFNYKDKGRNWHEFLEIVFFVAL